jgi:hypothetical protein
MREGHRKASNDSSDEKNGSAPPLSSLRRTMTRLRGKPLFLLSTVVSLGATALWIAPLWEPVLAGSEQGARAEYMGGTVPEIPQSAEGFIQTLDAEIFRFRARKGQFAVPYSNINLLEYGQQVSRRYVVAVLVSPVFLLSKSRQHFLTIGFTDDDGKQQALVFKVAKKDVRFLLPSLEARSGRKVEYQDDEARKAGKG